MREITYWDDGTLKGLPLVACPPASLWSTGGLPTSKTMHSNWTCAMLTCPLCPVPVPSPGLQSHFLTHTWLLGGAPSWPSRPHQLHSRATTQAPHKPLPPCQGAEAHKLWPYLPLAGCFLTTTLSQAFCRHSHWPHDLSHYNSGRSNFFLFHFIDEEMEAQWDVMPCPCVYKQLYA